MSRFVHIAISLLFVIFVLAAIVISVLGYVLPPKGTEWTGVTDKTFWHWLELVIAPVLLSGGGFLLYTAWAWSDHRLAEKHAREAERHANLASIAKAYIDDIEELLLRADPKDAEKLSVIAWARTLNVLEGLDGNRKGGIIQFLSNVGLLEKPKPTGQQLFIDLGGANLSDAVLSNADLSDATGVDIEELERQAASLEGATMPNGQKYEDWLKSKGRREDGENSGPS